MPERERGKVILDFCAHCGAGLSTGEGNTDEPRCSGCDSLVRERKDRIQGTFGFAEGHRLIALINGDDPEGVPF